MTNGRHRARDPGLRRGDYGRVTWVHCPECDGPAKVDSHAVNCIRCGYMTIQKLGPANARWVRISIHSPRCSHCRQPLPNKPSPTGLVVDGDLCTRVRCPHCDKSELYPAQIDFPPDFATTFSAIHMRLYLEAQIGGNTLRVDNLAHLDALETYLGATLRERGPVAGLTMMARLPAWMKSSVNRQKVLRGLGLLRARALKVGIDE